MRLKFNDLPQTVRERLVKLTTAGTQDPRILLQSPDFAGGWFKYVTAIGGLGVIAFCIHFLVRRGLAGIHPRHDEEVFAGLAAGTFVLAVSLAAIAFRFIWKKPPYREGKWVFPSGLTQLSGGWVEFLPFSQLGRPTLVTVRRNGSYAHSRLELGGPFTFMFATSKAADEAVESIHKAKVRMLGFIAAADTASIAAIDPFAECTLSGKWTAPTLGTLEGPTADIVPTAATLAQWLGALFLAGAAAAAAFAFFSMAFKHH